MKHPTSCLDNKTSNIWLKFDVWQVSLKEKLFHLMNLIIRLTYLFSIVKGGVLKRNIMDENLIKSQIGLKSHLEFSIKKVCTLMQILGHSEAMEVKSLWWSV